MADGRLRRALKSSPIAWAKRHPRAAIAIYGVLLIANWIIVGEVNFGRGVWGERYMADIAHARELVLDTPGLPVRATPLHFWVASRGDLTDPAQPPALLLHGSPGAAYGFMASADDPGLVGALEQLDRAVIWVDLPGFASEIDPSRRFTSYSADAYADVMLAVLHELGVQRAHVVGWSNGGAVGLRMIEEDPARVASLTLLASVGLQETEGSGSYAFEHAKYAFGQVALGAAGWMLPPVGWVAPTAETRAFLANFQQTDQRELRPIMETLETPTLILHGRHDFLTPAWGAELHHETIPSSRLVMLEGSHFIPMMQADLAAAVMEPFFARHDTPAVEPITTYEDRAPNPARTGVARAIEWVGQRVRWTPWWALVAGIALLARWRPELAAVLAGMYVGRVDLDFGVAFLGLFVGRMTRTPTPFDGPRWPLGWLGHAAWSGVAIFAVFLAEQDTFPWRLGPDDAALRFGAVGLAAYLVVVPTLLHVVRNLLRRRGRQRLRAQWAHLRSHEHWPSWVMYLPCVPIWVGHAFRPGGVLAFTAANPGIPDGGGITGESKSHILRALGDDPRVLPHELIDEAGTAGERAERALRAINERPELGGYPVILKPNSGERGSDVRLARTPADVRAFFERVREDAVVQRYAPGPAEFGVLWVRLPHAVAHEPEPDQPAGSIFAITDKRFPEVVGDGERTLGELVLAHPRGRTQAAVLFARFGERTREVIAAGERVRFTNTGNHIQGSSFHDGGHLIRPGLERAIDDLARGFADEHGRGLDCGRFDIRCPSGEHLARAEELAVVELNGVLGEATTHYDPDRSALFAWGVLRRQWKRVYEVSEARVAAGGEPISWGAFFRVLRSQRQPVGSSD